MLRRAGLVAASRGPGGGYRLQRPADEIRVSDVFRAVEDNGNSVDGAGRDWAQGPAAGLWDALDEHIELFLNKVSLADLVSQAANGGVSAPLAARSAALSGNLKLA